MILITVKGCVVKNTRLQKRVLLIKKSISFIIIFAAIAGGLFWFTQNQSNGREKGLIRYKEYQVRRGDFKIEVTASGLVRPIHRIEIKSKASGEIVDLPVKEGDRVKQGDIIAKLDQKDERSSLALAEAEVVIARAEQKQAELMFNRRNTLFRKKIISEEEREKTSLQLAVAKGKVIQATTELERAKDRLNDSIVRAPIDGIILQKFVEKGQIISSGVSNVSGGTPIFDIANMQTVYIEAGIDEIDIGKVNVGQSATIVAKAYPDITFEGEIIRIAPEAKVEENVTLFDVIIEVANTGQKLKSGMNATIKIISLSKENILLVPVIVLRSDKQNEAPRDQRFVLLKAGAEFSKHDVKIGLSNFKQVEILSGLKEGDILGVEMTSRLRKANERLEKRIKKSRSFGGKKKK